MHKWIMSFDLNSLYPHLIMQYNISPETLVAQDKVKDMSVDKLLDKKVDTSILKGVTLTPNGALFKTTKRGFLPEIMQSMYDDRVKYKKRMLQAKQDYENTKNPKLLKDIAKYNNIQLAKRFLSTLHMVLLVIIGFVTMIFWFEAITTSGQLSIRWIGLLLMTILMTCLRPITRITLLRQIQTRYMLFLTNLLIRFLKKNKIPQSCPILGYSGREKIEPFINKSYEDLHQYVNSYEQKMEMSREVIADKGIWTAKKRYILNVHDNEGVKYKEPQLKIMGIEAVKSSTPEPCREKIKEGLKIIMNGTEKELNTFIQDFREEFMTLSPEDIAYPRSVNGLSKFSDSNQLFRKDLLDSCEGSDII